MNEREVRRQWRRARSIATVYTLTIWRILV